mgnify:CR=1 FL=1
MAALSFGTMAVNFSIPSLKINSNSIYKTNNIKLKIDFKDSNNKEYSIDKDYPVKVTNVPLFVRLFKSFS